MQSDAPSRWSTRWPGLALLAGVLLIGGSLLPWDRWAPRSRWSRKDSAAHDRVSTAYKELAYGSPARRGQTETEWEAERDRMRQQLEALSQQLQRAQAEPRRWSHYLLSAGVLLAAAGFSAQQAHRG